MDYLDVALALDYISNHPHAGRVIVDLAEAYAKGMEKANHHKIIPKRNVDLSNKNNQSFKTDEERINEEKRKVHQMICQLGTPIKRPKEKRIPIAKTKNWEHLTKKGGNT
jgi:hypothetical protein